jgi:hypothetical protein
MSKLYSFFVNNTVFRVQQRKKDGSVRTRSIAMVIGPS